MGAVILLITTFIWGTAFLAQKLGGDSLGPIAITTLRNILGGAFLFVCILLRNRGRKRSGGPSLAFSVSSGIFCGIPLFAAMAAQQIGIQYTMPGISAFLTTNYVLFVPVLAAIVMRKLPPGYVWLCVAIAIAGTYFICLPPDGKVGLAGIGKGEAWTIVCAFLFAIQMLAVDRYAAKSDVLVLSAVQLLTCAVLGAPLMLLMPSEAARLTAENLRGCALPLVYLGIFSSGIAYTLQNVGQAKTPPALAAILLSLESVFGVLSGWIVLGDVLSPMQFFGCALVFLAAVSSQLFARWKPNGRSKS